MHDFDWSTFAALPGAADRNWELLCRELVRRNYARYGRFGSVNQQPGVEFHLALEKECGSLGAAGAWWGWQCRWYSIQPGRSVGKQRRNRIIDAIRKSERHLPDLTDWVLWTRQRLTPADQKWFHAISAKPRLHLWSEEEVQGLLTGDAAILRETYFGQLVLTPERLANLHQAAVAPIKHRWNPNLHVEVRAERIIQKVLGEKGRWDGLLNQARRLQSRIAELQSQLGILDGEDRPVVEEWIHNCRALVARLRSLPTLIDAGRRQESLAVARRSKDESIDDRQAFMLARKLRSRRLPASMYLPAMLSERKRAFKAIEIAERYLKVSFVAVVGRAGHGKSFLSAQLTAPSPGRPAGVLLLGRNLASKGTLDELARKIVGANFHNFAELLEAIDAAGARAGRRLPIVIDGLNESENPRDWHDELATLTVLLKQFRNVVVVVTLRKTAVSHSLPEGTARLRLYGFSYDMTEAVERYFEHYKIDAPDVELPLDYFKSPLFLFLFCEATNPDKENVVGIDAIPQSLIAVFEAYRKVAIKRVARDLKLAELDIGKALEGVAIAMWTQQVRHVPFDELRQIVGDGPRDWDRSLARALEEEGVLSRDVGDSFVNQRSSVLFDGFAGFLIADAVISQLGRERICDWLAIPANAQLLTSRYNGHPLGEDILVALVGLFPRRLRSQLWRQLEGSLQDRALMETLWIEGEFIDSETINEFARRLPASPSSVAPTLFGRMQSARRGQSHPLNADFLDRLLREMPVKDRDLIWSEWLRSNATDIVDDLRDLELDWRERGARMRGDELAALWCVWTLTSTVQNIRDQATRSLFSYGVAEPSVLFDLAVRIAAVNDPYVVERVFAAAYGVVITKQGCQAPKFVEALKKYLQGLQRKFIANQPAGATNHWLTRQYVIGSFEFAQRCLPQALPEGINAADAVRFAARNEAEPGSMAVDGDEHELMFPRDFERSVQSLIPYDADEEAGYPTIRSLLSRIQARVNELGWERDTFEDADRAIQDYCWSSRRRSDIGDISQYREKYARIGLLEVAGALDDAGLLNDREHSCGRIAEVDIDPSFPESPLPAPFTLPPWAESSLPDAEWLPCGSVDAPNHLFRIDKLNDAVGPWVAVSGYIKHREGEREVFGILRGILVDPNQCDSLVQLMSQVEYPGNDFVPGDPDDYYLFAGEIPWSRHFAMGLNEDSKLGPYEQYVGKWNSPRILVETLAHGYSWESHHSPMNEVSEAPVPSERFSNFHGLSRVPPAFDHIDRDGRPASLTFMTPVGFSGNVLYLREDLLDEYAKHVGRELIWIVWGERNILGRHGEFSPELSKTYRTQQHIWRQIVKHSELRVVS